MYYLAKKITKYIKKVTKNWEGYTWTPPEWAANGLIGGTSPSIQLSNMDTKAYQLLNPSLAAIDIPQLQYWILIYTPQPLWIKQVDFRYTGEISSCGVEVSNDGLNWKIVSDTQIVKNVQGTFTIKLNTIQLFKYHRFIVSATKPTTKCKLSVEAYDTQSNAGGEHRVFKYDTWVECSKDQAEKTEVSTNSYVFSKNPEIKRYKQVPLPDKKLTHDSYSDRSFVVDFTKEVCLEKIFVEDIESKFKYTVGSGENSHTASGTHEAPISSFYVSSDNKNWYQIASNVAEKATIFPKINTRYLKASVDEGGADFKFLGSESLSERVPTSLEDKTFSSQFERFTTYTVDIKPAISQIKE